MQSAKIHRRPSTTRRTGVVLAIMTAVISGFAVFINGYGVQAWSGTATPATYTTFKNLIAACALILVGVVATRSGGPERVTRPATARQWLGLSLVAILGGALAFALFFEGLARVSSTQAAFIHKTLVIWVGILAIGLLRERLKMMHIAAIALLVVGQFLLVGGVGDVTFGAGELMILAATLLWSVEIIIAKRLLESMSSLTVGIARMVGGAAILIPYGLLSGAFAAMGAVSLTQIGWVLVTGSVLSAYVGTWYAALQRAPALDVTSILVGGAVITALLRSVVAGTAIASPFGLMLVATGAAVAIAVAIRSATADTLAASDR
jgi:drug/metabolite transporter (DMT)-like permease